MKVHLSPGTTIVELVCPEPSVFHAGCDFDDCTLDAVYCVGHALELAQVSDIEEAPKVRRALEDLLRRLSLLVRESEANADRGGPAVPVPACLLGHWADLLFLAKAARETLARYPQ